ncbi:MAG: 30S ribosomal protein S6 [Chloroflexi bacterium]|nr:30S ribosomal protein S6 [Chloroflexota bacterium]
MRNYELVVIIHPDLDDEAINGALDKVKDWITKAGGSIENVDNWGKRHMAYEIQKQNEGVYFLLNTAMPPEFIAELERNLKILEPVMRYLIVAK